MRPGMRFVSVALLFLLPPDARGGCVGPRTPDDLRSVLWGGSSGYQRNTRPGVAQAAANPNIDKPWAAKADNVTLDLGVLSLSVVSLQTGTYTVEMVLTTRWVDQRLRCLENVQT